MGDHADLTPAQFRLACKGSVLQTGHHLHSSAAARIWSVWTREPRGHQISLRVKMSGTPPSCEEAVALAPSRVALISANDVHPQAHMEQNWQKASPAPGHLAKLHCKMLPRVARKRTCHACGILPMSIVRLLVAIPLPRWDCRGCICLRQFVVVPDLVVPLS